MASEMSWKPVVMIIGATGTGKSKVGQADSCWILAGSDRDRTAGS
jgi:hypothetical protein